MFKNLYYWNSPVKNNKCKELQIYLSLFLSLMVEFKIDLSQEDTNIFNFYIDLFGLISTQITKSKKTDHAGLWLELKIFGLTICYRKHDTRHWDHEKETWEVYD